jgi:predicted 3-demethylubiquinone-9 3-methyltransferase (glyoxalase superfamily)
VDRSHTRQERNHEFTRNNRKQQKRPLIVDPDAHRSTNLWEREQNRKSGDNTMGSSQKITTCLWFDNQAEEAANFYCSVFKNSKMGKIARYGDSGPGRKGDVMVATFELDGHEFMGLNGGPMFKFTEAISLVVHCEDQAEIDYYWEKLTADGGQESQCGWLKDKFGLSWQIVPSIIGQLLTGDTAKANRVMQAVMPMKKLDIQKMKDAYEGK